MARDPSHVFLSGATGDFQKVRTDLSQALTRGLCKVTHQEFFPQTTSDTLLKLAQLIEPCGIIIHMIGENPGTIPTPEIRNQYIETAERDGPFLANRRELREALDDFSTITYTQWEAYIAIHRGIPLLVYADASHASPTHPQRAHLDRLQEMVRYATPFEDHSSLHHMVMADLMAHFSIHPSTKDISSAPSYSPGPIHLPQPRLGDIFTGRTGDLKTLTASHFTAPHHPGEKPLVLHGPPGVGKTTLACELLYQIHDRHLLGHVFLIPAADPMALTSSLPDLAARLGLISSDHGHFDPTVAHAALCQWLTKPGIIGKALFYFDNADTPAARDAVLAEIKALGYPRALVTSRRDDWQNARLHPVETWTPAQAAKYLGKCLLQLSQSDIGLLTEALGGLPLAFELAVALIKTRHYTVPDLLEQWRSHLPGQRILSREGNPTVTALLAVSLDTLDDDTLTLLQILSFYAAQSIPEQLIATCAIKNWRESLATLHSASLLVWESFNSTVTLHPFLREAIFQEIPATSWEVFLGVSAEMLSRYLPSPSWTPDRWQEWPCLLPHCQIFVGHTARVGLVPDPLSLWASPVVRIINEAAMYYSERAAFREAEPLLREALRIDRAKNGNSHPEVAARLNNLSTVLQDTKETTEAELLMREALQIYRSTYGDNDQHVARALNNLAQLLQAAGRLSDAEPLMREGLEIELSAKGYDHPHVAIQLSNLAQLLQSTNRRAEAEPLFREAIRISSATLGDDHPQLAADLSNLAVLLYNTDRLPDAEPLMKNALRIDRLAFGDDHPRVAANLNNLASLLETTERLSEAEPLRWELLRIDHAKYGEDHPQVVRDRNILLFLLQAMDRVHEAEPLMRDTLRIDRAIFGEEHPNVAIRLNNLAALLKGTNRLAEAESLMRDALRILHDSLGPEHSDTVAVSENMEILLVEMRGGE